jgi:hypothetical protein
LKPLLTIWPRCSLCIFFLLFILFWWRRWNLFFLVNFWHIGYFYLCLGRDNHIDKVHLFLYGFLRIFTLLFQRLSFGTFAFILRIYRLQSLGCRARVYLCQNWLTFYFLWKLFLDYFVQTSYWFILPIIYKFTCSE